MYFRCGIYACIMYSIVASITIIIIRLYHRVGRLYHRVGIIESVDSRVGRLYK